MFCRSGKWRGIALLLLLFLLTRGYEFDRFGKKKAPKKPPTPQKKPAAFNPDLLPPLTAVLQELELMPWFQQFVQMGVSETHFLLRLTAMDYRIMMMEWEGMTEGKVEQLKKKSATLYELALVKDKDQEEINVAERNKLRYGRVYVPGGVQNHEYVTASFGATPPFGALEMVMAPAGTGKEHWGCSEDDYSTSVAAGAYTNKMLVVRRGNCSFLAKATLARQLNVSVLLVVNNEDRLDSPASGLGIDPNVTEKMVDAVAGLSIISVANTSWAKLAFSAPAPAHIVPLKCGPGGTCKPTLEEEKALQSEVSWGTARFKSTESKEVRSFEFLTSNFGGRLPENHDPLPVVMAVPPDGCSTFSAGDYTSQPLAPRGGFALAFARGGCRFHVKLEHAEAAGARLVVIYEREEEDNALQRVGGMLPDAGYIGIPCVIVSAPAGVCMRARSSVADTSVSVSLNSAGDTAGADRWIDLAFTDWAESDEERLLQIEGLSQKHAQAGNVEQVAWLRRRADKIKSVLPVATDEL